MTLRSFLVRAAFQCVAVGMAVGTVVFAQEKPESPSPAAEATSDEKPSNAAEKDTKPEAGAAAGVTPEMKKDPAAQLLEHLKPERLSTLAEMIEQDWKERPEWAEMAIAIMRNQAMQPGGGWWRSTEKKYGWTWLKRKYDRNADNLIEREELATGTPRVDQFFRRLDRDLDNKIKATDFDVSVFQGSSPDALKARMTDFLFRRLDTDTNGQVTQEELAKFFDKADREKSAFITAEDLLEALSDLQPQKSSPDPSSSDLLGMFFSGQLGWFEEGPKLGQLAPDFSLATHDQKSTVKLSDFREKKPVVLIFGSFT